MLEITERASLDAVPDARSHIRRLREMGFRIAVDDLGAGYAGLTSFTLLEPEIVKLDMSLIRDVHQNSTKQKVVRSMTALAKDMGKQLVLPQLRWKYAWMARVVGWGAAKEAQFILPSFKASMMRHWDQVMYRLERRNTRTGVAQTH